MANFLLLIILINCYFCTIWGDYSLLELESSEDDINYAELNISALEDITTKSPSTTTSTETIESTEPTISETTTKISTTTTKPTTNSTTTSTTTTTKPTNSTTTSTTTSTKPTTVGTIKTTRNPATPTECVGDDDVKVLRCLSTCSDPVQFINHLDHCLLEKIDKIAQCQQDVRDKFNMSIGECSLRCRRDPDYFICTQECSIPPYIAYPLIESKYCQKECDANSTDNTTTTTTRCESTCLESKNPQDCLDFCEKDPELDACLEMCQTPQVLTECIENCTINQENNESPQFKMDYCIEQECKSNCSRKCYKNAQGNHCIHRRISNKFGKIKSCKWNVDMGQYLNKESPKFHNVQIFKTFFDEMDAYAFGRDKSEQMENPYDNGYILGSREDGERLDQDRNKSVNATHIFLDYNMMVTFNFSFLTYNPIDIRANRSIKRLKISKIEVTIDEYDKDLFNIQHEKVPHPTQSIVRYYVRVQLINQYRKLSQTLSGKNFTNVPLLFHLKGIHSSCSSNDPMNHPNTVSTLLHIGCPPSTNIRFNWNASVNSLKINDQYGKYGTSDHCWKGRQVCFYKESPIVLHFDVFDDTIRNYTLPYEGKFMMRVIGSGYNEEDLKMFDRDEIKKYNFPDVANSALIWSLVDEKELNKNLHESSLFDGDFRELILTSGKSKIRWVCNTYSPCAKIIPRWDGQTAYYLRIKISNKLIEQETLCLHEHEFNILLYGFKPSAEIMIVAIIIFSTLFVITLLVMYLCARNEKVVWLRSKYKFHLCFKAIFSIFPRPSRSERPEVLKERKNKVFLSLQGHLKVPVVAKSNNKIKKTKSKERITKSRKKSFYKRQKTKLEEEKMKTWMDNIYSRMLEKKLNEIINEQNEKKLKRGSRIKRQNKNSREVDAEKDKDGEPVPVPVENNEEWKTQDEGKTEIEEQANDMIDKDAKEVKDN